VLLDRDAAAIHARSSATSRPASRAAPSIVASSSSSSPRKFRMRRRRRRTRIARSDACSRAATTARHAGSVAASRGRTCVAIGILWSAAILRMPSAMPSGVKPRSAYSSGDADSPTSTTSQRRRSP
jgi:hypothetical protein